MSDGWAGRFAIAGLGAIGLELARLVAGVFSILTPLWIVIDMYLFTWPQWGYLAALRIAAR